jgi:hypothetical protein
MRSLVGIALPLILAGSQSAASGEIAHPCSAGASPSNFDYLVLASLADAQRPISLALYRRSEVPVQFEKN